MAKYKATRDGVINVTTVSQRPGSEPVKEVHPQYIKAGETFDWLGPKGSWMELVEAPKEIELPQLDLGPKGKPMTIPEPAGSGDGKKEAEPKGADKK